MEAFFFIAVVLPFIQVFYVIDPLLGKIAVGVIVVAAVWLFLNANSY